MGDQMILSLRHNYIYIRTKKTGSTTIERLLTQNLGPDDIVIERDFNVLKPLLKPGAEPPIREKDSDTPLSPTHVSIAKVAPRLREDFWNSAFKFTSERHPYEKAVSFAYWRWTRTGGLNKNREESGRDFDQHLDQMVRTGKWPSFALYSIGGAPVVDDFIKLESLEKDIERILGRIGIAFSGGLSKTRTESRADRRPAREILSEEQRKVVYERCRREFELLGYER